MFSRSQLAALSPGEYFSWRRWGERLYIRDPQIAPFGEEDNLRGGLTNTKTRLLYRAWLTLWKPVPELISILGVEVPDAPNVSLTGVKADNVTIHWQSPDPSKPVQSYFIQVNGVNSKPESHRLRSWLTKSSWRSPRCEKQRDNHQTRRTTTGAFLQYQGFCSGVKPFSDWKCCY